MEEDLSSWSEEKLLRKRDQAWEMASLARQDCDRHDAARRVAEANRITEELRQRKEV